MSLLPPPPLAGPPNVVSFCPQLPQSRSSTPLSVSTRDSLYREVEAARDSKVLAYITGDRRGLETRLASDVADLFVAHLDEIGVSSKISLILYTRGGEVSAAWHLANLIRAFCDKLEIIVPAKCHSAGTLLCLAADTLVMTKQATLSPIDPTVNTLLNPQSHFGQHQTVPVSVEDLNAYLDQAASALGPESISSAFDRLAQEVHPLVIGHAYRARSHIRMLGQRLLSGHITNSSTTESILDFLCSESGSHDYTIHRREAKTQLGLPVETPSEAFYESIKSLYNSIASDLDMAIPYDPHALLGHHDELDYAHPRAILESVSHPPHVFVSEGRLRRRSEETTPGVFTHTIQDQRTFEGWRSL